MPWGRNNVYCATSGTLANGQVACPNISIVKFARISENKLNFNPWGRKGAYVELWQMAKLVLKQSVKAHGPLVLTSQLKAQIRAGEHQIRLRSRQAEARWSSDKFQQSTTGNWDQKVKPRKKNAIINHQ